MNIKHSVYYLGPFFRNRLKCFSLDKQEKKVSDTLKPPAYVYHIAADNLCSIVVQGRTVEAFSIFKRGIRPEWEDPANRDGSELACRRAFTNNELDRFWENLVFGMIGEVIDIGDEITGCRVIDKSKKGSPKPLFKIEVWLRSENCDYEKIKKSILEVLGDTEGLKAKGLPEFEFKLHNTAGGHRK